MRQQWPDLTIRIEHISTTGDRISSIPLTQIGGDGVFVTEIERALQERRIDLAVHSLKDLPTLQPDNLSVVVVGPREDVRDVLVSHPKFRIVERDGELTAADPLDGEALRIGTCSLRRTAQIGTLLPHATILPVRGNVDTRLRKLEAGEYDAILLAAAGLHRLDGSGELRKHLSGRLTYLSSEMMLSAPGQGAIALECRADSEMLELLAPLQDRAVQAATSAERMFMRRLGAGCYLPVASYGEITSDILTLQGLVISVDGARRVRVRQTMPWSPTSTIAEAEKLGVRLAEEALAQGADQIIGDLVSPASEREQEHSHA